jgi:hypothetical protein
MFRSRTNRLPKSVIIMLFAILALAAFGCPRSAFAVHRASYGLEIDAGDYEYLSEYGEWLEVPQFGMIWRPYVVEEWEPFFHGHWSWTNDGWAWVSYEPFGWLVYHYGYWYNRPDIGWFWLPGRIWSPARVEWYTYGDYCAWAPIPPPNYYWPDPWDRRGVNIWMVININNFTNEYVGHHRIGAPFHGEKIGHGAWIRQAPGIRHIETIARRQIAPVRISRERVDLRPNTPRVPAKYYRPKEIERKRMVLPQQDVNRVKQHSPQVEREVLVPRERAPKREPQRAPEKQTERKSEDRQKKTIKRR